MRGITLIIAVADVCGVNAGRSTSIVGAGSAQFSALKDICLTENLRGSHITFMDIDEDGWISSTGWARSTPASSAQT
jgi:hypothetical protein